MPFSRLEREKKVRLAHGFVEDCLHVVTPREQWCARPPSSSPSAKGPWHNENRILDAALRNF